MTFDLHEKIALMTGASAALGQQFVRLLSEEGGRVILAAELDDAKAIKEDVSDKKSLKRCLSELKKDGEKSDTCVNNARVAALTLVFQEGGSQNFESIIQTRLMRV